jgi:cell division protein FtsB
MSPRNTQHGASTSARPRRRQATAAKGTSPRTTKPSQRPAARKPAAKTAAHRPFLPTWATVVLGAVIIGVLLASYYPVARVQYRELRERARLEAELVLVKQHNEKLRRDVAHLKTPEGVEDLARTDLGLVKKGEHVVVVVDEDETSTPVAPRIDDVPEPRPAGAWTAFLDRFFGVN